MNSQLKFYSPHITFNISRFTIATILILYSFSINKSFSQQPDTSFVPIDELSRRLSDTTNKLSDTLKKVSIDSLKKTGEIDDIIKYSAKDSAIFDIKDKKLMLYNEGDLKY